MLFKLLRAAYGPKFNAFLSKSNDPDSIAKGTETAIRTWAILLKPYSNDVIAKAVIIAGESEAYKEWPATAYQFRDLCKDIVRRREQREKSIRFSERRALQKPIDFESAKHHLNVIRQILKVSEA